jgi:hypothetical protein
VSGSISVTWLEQAWTKKYAVDALAKLQRGWFDSFQGDH